MADLKKGIVLDKEEKELIIKRREEKEEQKLINQELLLQKKSLEKELKREYSDEELIKLGRQVIENEVEILMNEIFELEN